MGRSQADAAKSKARIVSEATQQFRKRGIEVTTVADVMLGAGLTHGGFYRHFKSKEELSVAAIRSVFAEMIRLFDKRMKEAGPDMALQDYAEFYLSKDHVRLPESGCAVPSLGAEAARNGKIQQAAFADGIEAIIERVALAKSDGLELKGSRARKEAIRHLALLVGAVVAARSVGRDPLSDEILDACRVGQPNIL